MSRMAHAWRFQPAARPAVARVRPCVHHIFNNYNAGMLEMLQQAKMSG
jgi:hypothetical protein